MIIQTDGTLWAVGGNQSGQLGDGTRENRQEPVQLGTATWIDVAVGGIHTVAIRSDGSLWTWGGNLSGQLGDGSGEEVRLTPTQIGTDTDWANVGAGGVWSAAIRTDGSLWTWGWVGAHGPERDLSRHDASSTPVRIGADTDWASVADVDRFWPIALKTDGSLWHLASAPVRIGTDRDWASIPWLSGLRADGSLWRRMLQYSEWGLEEFAQVGTDTNWASVCGNIAIKADGSLWHVFLSPDGGVSSIQIGTDRTWISASGSGARFIALNADGELWQGVVDWERDAAGLPTSDRPSSVRMTNLMTGEYWVQS